MRNLYNKLKTTFLKIQKGIKYLEELMSEIPSNVILLKAIPGLGATHLETYITNRNVIILEPNVPVIRGKKRRGILGVYEGVCIQDIVAYLSNPEFKYKKILVTPESFYKVKEAAQLVGINIYNDYFLLFDECDRTAKDVDFRERIIEPMDDFFKFKSKAFISATAMMPSDPRFAQQQFTQLVLVPQYDIAKKLKLVLTNNVINAFKQTIAPIPEQDKICVFFNTTLGIATLIDQLGIKEECAVFCSKEKMTDLRASGIANAHEHIDVDKMKKYNFFTSRFYAAVDIIMENETPHVFMLTDLHTAQHTMIDPNSDAVQIVGRFRNGVASIAAISNIDDTISYKTKEQAKSYLEGCEHSYMDIRGLKNASTDLGSRETLQKALELVPYADFMLDEQRRNHFMRDHYFHMEQLRSYYTHGAKLVKAYRDAHVKGSTRRYFEVETSQLPYPVGDKDMKYRNPLIPYKDKVALVINILEQYNPEEGGMFVIDNYDIVFTELEKLYPEILRGYEVLGKEELKKIGFSKADVRKAIARKLDNEAKNHFPLIDDLHRTFADGEEVEQSLMLDKFDKLIKKHGVVLSPTIANFSAYFRISKRYSCMRNRNKKCRRIIGSRYRRS